MGTFLSSLATWLVRTIGIGGCAFLGLWIYDWGIPGANRIPYLVNVPILGDLTTGRAHTFAADQVKLADVKWAAKIEGMVTSFERDALAAQLEAERSARLRAEFANTEATKRAEALQRSKEVSDTELERLRQEAAQDSELQSPTAKELEWLSKH